jgi:hypothetical protein
MPKQVRSTRRLATALKGIAARIIKRLLGTRQRRPDLYVCPLATSCGFLRAGLIRRQLSILQPLSRPKSVRIGGWWHLSPADREAAGMLQNESTAPAESRRAMPSQVEGCASRRWLPVRCLFVYGGSKVDRHVWGNASYDSHSVCEHRAEPWFDYWRVRVGRTLYDCCWPKCDVCPR